MFLKEFKAFLHVWIPGIEQQDAIRPFSFLSQQIHGLCDHGG
jgi:hypothetical protein